MGDKLLARDGCLNFFAGPTNPDFTAERIYNVHYASTHRRHQRGNTDDMIESLEMSAGKINPAAMITHIGGLDGGRYDYKSAQHQGRQKLIYTNKSMPLVAIEDFNSARPINSTRNLPKL